MRRNIRGPGPDMSSLNQGERWKGSDFKGPTPDRRGTHTEEQWSDGRGHSIESVGNERECNDWKRHGDRGPRPIHEGPDEQVQEHSRQGPPLEWRGPGNRGPKAIQERQNMQGIGPGDDWTGSHFKGPGPVRDDQDMKCPGPSGGGSGNEWREPDRGGAGPNRWGPGQFFRGARGPGMRGPGSDIRMGNDMGSDCRQPDFRGNVRGSNMEGPEAHRGGPDRRAFEIEGLDKQGPRGPESGCTGPENRNSKDRKSVV